MSTNNPSLSSSDKVLVVLEAALDNPRFSDIVNRTGLAKATVHRILATLSEREFVVAGEDGHYTPGPCFLALAGNAFAQLTVPPLAHAIAAELSQEVHCTVHLGAPSGDEIVYLARIDSDKPYLMPSRVGAVIPMHSSGIGKYVLAGMSDDEVSNFVARKGLERRTARTITTEKALKAEIADIRKNGYSLDREENVPGIVCIATGFSDYTGRISYGISISSLALEHTEEQLIEMEPALKSAALRITEALGGQHNPPGASNRKAHSNYVEPESGHH